MRLINADELIKVFGERVRVEQGGDGTKERWAYMAWLRSINAVKDAPTIDAVEVVRCKDCKHYQFISYGFCNGGLSCFDEVIMEPNDFCSYGERKK